MITTANSKRLMEISSPVEGSFFVTVKYLIVFDWISGGQDVYHQNFKSDEYPPAANKEESLVEMKSVEQGTRWAIGHFHKCTEG